MPPAAPDVAAPRVVAVEPGSPAALAGLAVGDEILALNGVAPRDVLEYRQLADEAEVELEVSRGGLVRTVEVVKQPGEPLGVEVHSALFDEVRTCDNHCSFCFIYQLPPGLRPSLYVKDDDYRLSFLYGNFTTLTRFTEADLERVVAEGLSPLHVSIHATDPALRAHLLRNRRGAVSLRWLRALLDAGVEVHGQVVVCPGLNDGGALERTLGDVADRYPELASLCVVPLGLSRFNREPELRPHTVAEASAVIDTVEAWQTLFLGLVGRRLAFCADEYYLLAGRPLPPAEAYEGFPMHEDGVGIARTFELEFTGAVEQPTGVASGFFAWVDGAPAEGYRAPRQAPSSSPAVGAGCGVVAGAGAAVGARGVGGAQDGAGAGGGGVALRLRPRAGAPVGILTGTLAAPVLASLVAGLGRPDVRVIPVPNEFFGGTVGVAGLLVGSDLARVLAAEPAGHRYLVPDVCLSQGRFLDGTTPDDLPHPVEVVATDGVALRRALEERR